MGGLSAVQIRSARRMETDGLLLGQIARKLEVSFESVVLALYGSNEPVVAAVATGDFQRVIPAAATPELTGGDVDAGSSSRPAEIPPGTVAQTDASGSSGENTQAGGGTVETPAPISPEVASEEVGGGPAAAAPQNAEVAGVSGHETIAAGGGAPPPADGLPRYHLQAKDGAYVKKSGGRTYEVGLAWKGTQAQADEVMRRPAYKDFRVVPA